MSLGNIASEYMATALLERIGTEDDLPAVERVATGLDDLRLS